MIPFYELYTSQPFGIPDWIWIVSGLCLVIWCNFALGADSAIQPGSVIYFVVIYTVGTERVIPYTIARDSGYWLWCADYSVTLCIMAVKI